MNSLVLQQADLLKLLQGKQSRYVILAVNLLLVVWVASQLANLTWGMLSPDESGAPVVVAPRAMQTVNPDTRLISQLPAWHLMGEVQKDAAPGQTGVPVDAPDTRLQLTLRGALASDDPVNARAIIGGPRGKDQQYAVGDLLPGNAELSEIYPDRVILKRNGRYETLRLPQDSRPAPGVSARTVPTARASAGRSSQQRLVAARQQIRQNPKSLYNLLRAVPKRDKAGKPIGYTLSPGRDAVLFADLGLQNGDVAIQVNDLELSDPANAGKALQALQSGEPVTVKLLRGGQEQILTLAVP
jgi:general secretion pathway protein C